MRVLVLGGTRFIGPPVVTQLHEAGHDVTRFHRGRTHAHGLPAVPHVSGDRAHRRDFRATFAPLAPDVVLDMAPATEADARTVMDTVGGIAGRVVAISSGDVYRAFGVLMEEETGPPDPVPLTEEAPLRRHLYPHRGAAYRPNDDAQRWKEEYDKILVERVVMGDPPVPGTIVRLPFVYGPRDHQHRLFPYLSQMDAGQATITLDARLAGWRASRGHVENIAAAIVLAVTDARAQGRIDNVAESDARSEAEWVEAIGQAAGWGGTVGALPPAALPAQQRVRMNTTQPLTLDSTRIRAELGYREVVARPAALWETLVWERAHPPMEGDAMHSRRSITRRRA